MDNRELIMLQSLPLDIKIAKSKLRIEEFVRQIGEDKVYVSFSGGKDSTVLMHLVRSIFPNIVGVYCDTGLEYPEVKQFIYKQDNIEIIRPKLSFREVLDKYGYPVISKEQAQYIRQYRTAKSEKTKSTRWNGNKWGRGKISEKHKYLVNAPFKISEQCCDVMKKNPFKIYEKATNKRPILGIMAEESQLRKSHYLRTGCNSFDVKRESCKPLGFWTEQDILMYIKKYNIEIPTVYGDIIEEDNKLRCSKLNRTGCVFCLFGISKDGEKNRLELMKETHPKLYDYCLNNLGFKEVCDYINIKY